MDFSVIKVEVAKLVLRPEDTLVVRCTPPISGETATRIKRDLQQIVDHQKILVISSEIELQVLQQLEKRPAR